MTLNCYLSKNVLKIQQFNKLKMYVAYPYYDRNKLKIYPATHLKNTKLGSNFITISSGWNRNELKLSSDR